MTKLNYISHGRQVTGGYLHEKNLVEKLSKALAFKLHELRQWQHFENLQAHMKLFHWAFKKSDAELNVCVSRLALPSILRNFFSNRKTLVVWHYFDEKDKKSKFLKTYYQILIRISLFVPSKKLAFIAVAPYWKTYFEKEFKLKKVFYYPNFFEPNLYEKFIGSSKTKQIHLGQVSFKNSAELFYLAEQLFLRGYFCYFSTNDPNKVHQGKYFSVIYFDKHEDYLQKMAESEYTLAMPAIEEGWNRIAHESLLVGTQVIGFNKGGLGDLLRGSNAFMIGSRPINNQIEHFKTTEFGNNTMPPPTVVNAMYLILNQIQAPIHRAFLDQFNDSKAPEFITPICDWFST